MYNRSLIVVDFVCITALFLVTKMRDRADSGRRRTAATAASVAPVVYSVSFILMTGVFIVTSC